MHSVTGNDSLKVAATSDKTLSLALNNTAQEENFWIVSLCIDV